MLVNKRAPLMDIWIGQGNVTLIWVNFEVRRSGSTRGKHSFFLPHSISFLCNIILFGLPHIKQTIKRSLKSIAFCDLFPSNENLRSCYFFKRSERWMYEQERVSIFVRLSKIKTTEDNLADVSILVVVVLSRPLDYSLESSLVRSNNTIKLCNPTAALAKAMGARIPTKSTPRTNGAFMIGLLVMGRR